jgi:PAS domain S-box-containing protein
MDVIHPDDRAMVDRVYKEAVANRTPYKIVNRMVLGDGRTKWVEERGNTIYDDAGFPLRTTGTVQDINIRWRTEEAMRAISAELLALEGEAYFEAVARKISDLLDGDIVFITRFDRSAFDELETTMLVEDGQVMPNLRYNLAGKPCADVIQGAPRMVAKGVAQLYPENTFFAKRRIEAYAALPLIEHSGRIIGHLGFMSRRSVEDRDLVLTILNMFAVAVAAVMVRERGRRQYRDLFEFAPDGLVLSDEKGIIVLVNQQAEAIFGWAREDLIGQSIEILIPRAMRQAHVGLREDFMRSPKRRRMAGERQALQAQRKDGTVFPVEVDLAPVETDDGVMIAAAVRDIALRKALEAQLAQATKMEAIGKLTGGLAHDFNNYLGVIIGNLDLLRETEDVTPAQIALVNSALSGAERSADLTRSLLAFSRQQPLDPHITDINASIESVVSLLRRTLGEDITLKSAPSSGLWLARIDAALLDSCIVNLANNARDAMPRGGTLLIATRNIHFDDEYVHAHAGSSVGDYVLIEVTDTGDGMPPEVIARVFEPFFTTKQPGHGTGLGLSMVYGFVKQSGGYINIYSEPRMGTTIRIYLPRATSSGIDAEEASAISDGPTIKGGETILLVEDNDDLRETVVAQLSSLGYRVIHVSNAEAALIILEAGEPAVDLLFTDVIMPGPLSGFDLAEVATQRRPGIKILMTSGFPGDALRDNESKLAVGLLAKPYGKAALQREIRMALHGGGHEAGLS